MSSIDVPLQETPRPRGRRASRTASLIVAFLAVAGGTGGTWAAFSAATTNDASFSTGVLVLSNDREEAGACFSTDGNDPITDNAGDCDAAFALDAQAPGDEDSTRITLENEGNLDASVLQLYGAGACVTGDAASTGFHGNEANVCDDVQLMVQEYSSSANQGADTRTGGTCRYGLDANIDGQCDGFHASRNLHHFTVTAHPDFSTPVAMGPMPTGSSRWYRVFVKLDPAAGNGAQGRVATFGLTWRLEQ